MQITSCSSGDSSDTFISTEMHRYLSLSFFKFPKFRNRPLCYPNNSIFKHYLTQFTSFTIVPTNFFYTSNSALLKNMGNIWLQYYRGRKNRFRNFKFGAKKPLKNIYLFKQWENFVDSLYSFYMSFKLFCPLCLKHLSEYDQHCDAVKVLGAHSCSNTPQTNIHHCPCRKTFRDHKSFLHHILPVVQNLNGGLFLSECPIATFYWFFVAISSLDQSKNLANSFSCLFCTSSVSKDINSNLNISELDFFSWLYHVGFECSKGFHPDVEKCTSQTCFFSPLDITSKESLDNVIKDTFDVRNCFNTDFNLKLFKMHDFFSFSLNFNLSQKQRPSDLLSKFRFAGNKEDLAKIDFLFLNYPYACSKCFRRFKDVSLKYNHECVNNVGNFDTYSVHLCRCGISINSHSSFWHHALNTCFLLTSLHMLIFSSFKNLLSFQCFCNKFFADFDSMSQFLLHWNTCQVARSIFLKCCRHCQRISTMSNNSVINIRYEHLERNQKPKKHYKAVDINNHFSKADTSPPGPASLSIVANRCQFFSDKGQKGCSKSLFTNFNVATINQGKDFEQAVLIQSTFHIQQITVVKVHHSIIMGFAKYQIPIKIESKIIALDFSVKKVDFFSDVNAIENFLRISPIYFDRDMENFIIKKNPKLVYPSNCFKRLRKSLERVFVTHIPRDYGGRVIEYLEEPDILTARKSSQKNLFKALKNVFWKTERNILQSGSPMIPVFRKIASHHYDDLYKAVQGTNLKLQYLKPVYLNMSISSESGGASEMNSYCKEIENIMKKESEDSENSISNI